MKTQTNWGIALFRIAVGVTFLAHGAQKFFVFGHAGVAGMMAHLGIPFPAVSAVLLMSAELFCGAALLLGVFTRWAAIPLAFSMLVALTQVHLKGGFFLPGGFEYVFVLLLANAGLALTGSGAFAIDNLLARKVTRSRPSELVAA